MFLLLRTNKNSVTESASNLDAQVRKANNKLFPKALKRGSVVNWVCRICRICRWLYLPMALSAVSADGFICRWLYLPCLPMALSADGFICRWLYLPMALSAVSADG
jgi:hypothetical protein